MKNYPKLFAAFTLCTLLPVTAPAQTTALTYKSSQDRQRHAEKITASGQTTAFTYQGKLTDASGPANGTFPTRFILFDAAIGGSAIGAQYPDVTVINGIFTVTLDFGANAFDGNARYLEIAIDGITLAPRQPITSEPYAIRSSKAAVADDALLLNGVAGSQYVLTTDPRLSDARSAASVNFSTATLNGVVPILNGGTGSNTKSFVDLTTNQTIHGRKTFFDPISGDGSGLTNLPNTGFSWQEVTVTSAQAQSNRGYVANNDVLQVTVTLPASPNVGDVVRVSGGGLGGWRIAQNAGQSITRSNTDLPLSWTPHESTRFWGSVASSANGSKLVIVAIGGAGQIYTSTDSGTTWTPRESNRSWVSVASSADGSKLVAVVNGGQIYTSTDSGMNWTSRESSRSWESVASSVDGSKLVAVAGEPGTGLIYTSTDSGASWTPRESNRAWISAASSADGSKLVAANNNGQIYTSTDSGISWAPRESNRLWRSIASSADGSRLVAVALNGQIYISTDSGVNWAPRESNREWSSVASSADGSKLVAVAINGQIYTSTDSGANWTPRESTRGWQSVASSADGSKLVAGVNGGRIYTPSIATIITTVGVSGYLSGGILSAIELQYIGGGKFIWLSHEGNISVN